MSSVATIMLAPHLGVVSHRDILAGVGGTIAAQFVIAADLVGGKNFWCLQMSGEMDVAQILPRGGNLAQGLCQNAFLMVRF